MPAAGREPTRTGQVEVIKLNGRNYLTLLTRQWTSGPWLEQHRNHQWAQAQSYTRAGHDLGMPGAALLEPAGSAHRCRAQHRSVELTADALNHAGLPAQRPANHPAHPHLQRADPTAGAVSGAQRRSSVPSQN